MKDSISDLIVVFFHPGAAISRSMQKKRWVIYLFILLVIQIITFAVLFNFNRVNESAQLSDSQLEIIKTYGPSIKKLMITFTLIIILITYLIGAFFIYLFYKIGNAEGLYVQYFSGFIHASLIDAGLGNIFKTIFFSIEKTGFAFFNAAAFFPTITQQNFLFHLLSQIDPISLWALTALAIGISRYSGITLVKSIRIAFYYLLFKISILSPFYFIFARFSSR